MKWIFLAAAAFLASSGPALAMSDAECTPLWRIAGVNGDGARSGTKADRHLVMMRIANKTVEADGTLTTSRIQESCKIGIFKFTAIEAGAPLADSNNFTETQAKDRIVAYGLAKPAIMIKDDNGIWRGTSMKDGKSINVEVDDKGNVVAQ